MTGASGFGQIRNDWIYYSKNSLHNWLNSKNESYLSPIDYVDYTHLLTEIPQYHESYFEIIHVVDGYDRLKLKMPKELIYNWLDFLKIIFLHYDENVWTSWLPLHIITEPKVWIMKRNSLEFEG